RKRRRRRRDCRSLSISAIHWEDSIHNETASYSSHECKHVERRYDSFPCVPSTPRRSESWCYHLNSRRSLGDTVPPTRSSTPRAR
ncbi:hypothetical protein PFISCL1PPCAC_24146, partial [Pristionchus fissidentatus]